MIKIASLNLNEDLKDYTRYLSEKGILHRVIEESGKQSIYVLNSKHIEFVKESLQLYLEKKLELSLAKEEHKQPKTALVIYVFNWVYKNFMASPITVSLIFISLVVAFLTSLGSNVYAFSFMFYPLISSESIMELLGDITTITTAARTISPMFLHFGELHLVFNMLWLWYFGKQLEATGSAWSFIAIILITSFVSNTAQYLAIDYNNFGGMSGVVYGLLGYAWIIHVFLPQRHLLINNSMFVFFVIALVLMELVASSWIATAAHLGGLASGLVIGLLTVFYFRWIVKYSIFTKTNSD